MGYSKVHGRKTLQVWHLVEKQSSLVPAIEAPQLVVQQIIGYEKGCTLTTTKVYFFLSPMASAEMLSHVFTPASKRCLDRKFSLKTRRMKIISDNFHRALNIKHKLRLLEAKRLHMLCVCVERLKKHLVSLNCYNIWIVCGYFLTNEMLAGCFVT